MKDITIPIPEIQNGDPIEVEVKVGKNKMHYNFRVVAFPWDEDINSDEDETEKSLERINKLKISIKEYDKNWEIIQIYTPIKKSKQIQVLYRKKTG